MGKIASDRRQIILNAVRRFNKRHFNPLILKVAGSTHSPFVVINHLGRRSGQPYKTPVLAMLEGDGFVFALTYGPKVDWYRNILATGKCTMLKRGRLYNLAFPETIDQGIALRAFPKLIRSLLRFNQVHHYFRMKIVTLNLEP
jgi:deazaflavin-dependent oxidoreductase (nitroreductase family)